MVSAGIPLIIPKEAFAMNENKVTINAMIAKMVEEARRLGYSESSIWTNIQPGLRTFAIYYSKKELSFYDPEITNEYVEFQKERMEKAEISIHYYRNICSAANRLSEFYLTDTLHLKMPKHGTKYLLREENERLVDCFLEYRNYGPNARDDVAWVVRKYLYHFETLGHKSLENVSVDDVREFIIKTASEVKTSSLHNILLYLKYFHIFLKETGIPAPDCADLFSYKVYRDMPIQSYVTDEELRRILAAINTKNDMGKRDRAIILTAATTRLRACDLIRLKLSDIDWGKGEIKIVQKKTGRTVYAPLVKETGTALPDYILNARPASGCPEVFLRAVAPKTAITNAVCIGCMFQQYQKKAGISRHAFDGKGFHGLRRHLAKKLLVTGTSLTTIAQILGYDDYKSSRQYLSLDTGNLKECDLDFRGIPLGRRGLGFPNWYYDMPMIMYSFLDQYDLSGKTIVPFVTSGGSGFSDAISTIEKMEPDADVVTDGLSISRNVVQDAEQDIIDWLSEKSLTP